MTEPRMYEASCPECGATIPVPERDVIGLWEGENIGAGKRDRDYEVTCPHCGQAAVVSALELGTLTPEGEA